VIIAKKPHSRDPELDRDPGFSTQGNMDEIELAPVERVGG
jgi:hypothetical protein